MKMEDFTTIRKDAQFIASVGEAVDHQVADMEGQFQTTPEGREVDYLKRVVEHYLLDQGNFQLEFLTVHLDTGKTGMQEVIETLENPAHQFNSDPKLAAKLKKLAEDIDKAVGYNDDKYARLYNRLIKEVDSLHTSKDIHEFILRFNRDVLAETQKFAGTRFPEPKIAKIVRDKDAKTLHATIMLERYELTVLLMKFAYLRMVLSDEIAKARSILGDVSFESLANKIGKVLKESPDKVWDEIQKVFPQDREDKNWTNRKSFLEKVENDKKKNIFIRVLLGSEQKKIASRIMEICSKGDERIINFISDVIEMLNQPAVKEKVENEARHEFKVLVEKEKKKMDGIIEGWRSEVRDMIGKRIDAIEAIYAKEIKKRKAAQKELGELNTELAVGGAYEGQINHDIWNTEQMIIARARSDSEILEFGRSITLFEMFAEGTMPFDKLMGALDESKIVHKDSGFIAQNTERIQTFARNYHEGRIPESALLEYIRELGIYRSKLFEQAARMENEVHSLEEQLKEKERRAEETDKRLAMRSREGASRAHELSGKIDISTTQVRGDETTRIQTLQR